MTVSNAFNHPDQLSAALRARVLERAAKMGYTGPDAVARQRRSGRMNTFGVAFEEKLSYAFSDPFSVAWPAAFSEVMEGLDVTVVPGSSNSRAAGHAAGTLALDRSDRPTAVVASSDAMAPGFMDACRQRGLEPGEDVSVAGFDGLPEAADARLSTIRQPFLEVENASAFPQAPQVEPATVTARTRCIAAAILRHPAPVWSWRSRPGWNARCPGQWP